MLLYPPKGTIWKCDVTVKELENLAVYDTKQNIIRNFSKKIYEIIKTPRFTYIKNANNCDLIYSTRGISLINKKPWIVDFEHVSHFVGLNRNTILNTKIQKKLINFLSIKYCKKILPHTKMAQNTFKSIFGEVFNNKMQVVYQTMAPTPLIRNKNDDKIRILFNGNFIHKGGNFVLDVFEQINERYNNLELIIISNPDNKIISKYKEYPNIFFYKKGPMITRDELINKFYMNSDIFLYPSQGDAYANPLLLAMNASLPIITTNYYAFPEFVENKKNGFMVHSHLWDIEKEYPKKNLTYEEGVRIINMNKNKHIRDLREKVELLIENKRTREEFGNYGRKMLENGKFSINNRNKILKKIFKESLT